MTVVKTTQKYNPEAHNVRAQDRGSSDYTNQQNTHGSATVGINAYTDSGHYASPEVVAPPVISKQQKLDYALAYAAQPMAVLYLDPKVQARQDTTLFLMNEKMPTAEKLQALEACRHRYSMTPREFGLVIEELLSAKPGDQIKEHCWNSLTLASKYARDLREVAKQYATKESNGNLAPLKRTSALAMVLENRQAALIRKQSHAPVAPTPKSQASKPPVTEQPRQLLTKSQPSPSIPSSVQQQPKPVTTRQIPPAISTPPPGTIPYKTKELPEAQSPEDRIQQTKTQLTELSKAKDVNYREVSKTFYGNDTDGMLQDAQKYQSETSGESFSSNYSDSSVDKVHHINQRPPQENKDVDGWYLPVQDTIFVVAGRPNLRTGATIAHETQHAIMKIENLRQQALLGSKTNETKVSSNAFFPKYVPENYKPADVLTDAPSSMYTDVGYTNNVNEMAEKMAELNRVKYALSTAGTPPSKIENPLEAYQILQSLFVLVSAGRELDQETAKMALDSLGVKYSAADLKPQKANISKQQLVELYPGAADLILQVGVASCEISLCRLRIHKLEAGANSNKEEINQTKEDLQKKQKLLKGMLEYILIQSPGYAAGPQNQSSQSLANSGGTLLIQSV